MEGPISLSGRRRRRKRWESKAAFERALGERVAVPEHYDVMGAYGSALLAKKAVGRPEKKPPSNGFENAAK